MKKTFILLFALCTATLVHGIESSFTLPTLKQWKQGKGEVVVTQQASVSAKDASLQTAVYLLQDAVATLPASDAKPVTIELQLTAPSRQPQPEAYTIQVKKGSIVVKGETSRGVLWGVQTLRQLLSQSPSLPLGTIQDQPDYPLRGYMIDCGRKYIPISYLYNLVNVMSYYKMNTLQVHLNDNGFKKYFHENWDETYAAFRIESELFPGLTARDGFYTKQEFRDLVRYAEKMGVEIIPEIDAPAHALAFTRFRPSLACEEYGADHLDLRNPQVIPFLDSLYQEYCGGPDPVFCGPRVHIGTDEYSNRDPEVVELFRALTDHLIRTVESYGKQACVWGALTHAKGQTPVKSDNVIMDMWYNGYADPVAMKEAGYKMVSISDGFVYIVPAAGYYYDYLNCQFLYERWTPANIGGVMFPERDPQIEGGMFAVWNDVCGNGISVGDIHHRTVPALQVIAQKTWHAVNDTIGYAQWNDQRQRIHLNDYELGNVGSAFFPTLKPDNTISHDGHEAQLGYDYEVSFDITWAQEQEGTVLTQSSRAKFYLSDPIGGWIGFSRDGYLFTFDYKGRPGRKEHIAIKGTNRETSLWVDGKLIQTLGYDQRLAADAKPYNVVRTLIFPLTETGNFKSAVTNFTAKKL